MTPKPPPVSRGRRPRPRWPWLVAALVLAVAGAWLMLAGDPVIVEPREVQLPTRMRAAERRRGEQRRTWLEASATDAGAGPAAPRPARDPVMALMPPTVEGFAMVAEFNALVNSDLGGLMMQCLFEGDDRFLGALRDAGVDPATSIDRVAIIDDTMVITGSFKGDGWRALVPGTPTQRGYGRQGQVYEWATADGGARFMGSWAEQMVIAGASREAIEQALDRLESPGTGQPGVLDEDQAWGELYGVIQPSLISEALLEGQPALAQAVRDSASSVRVHADARHDVGLVADIGGDDAKKTEELRRSLGGALAAARMQAQAKGHPDQAQLLDSARVTAAEDGAFRMSAGLPYELVQKALSDCVERRRARRAGPPDAGPPAAAVGDSPPG